MAQPPAGDGPWVSRLPLGDLVSLLVSEERAGPALVKVLGAEYCTLKIHVWKL